ncbi:chemotaxis response regulator protein-glutamate methylesterase [uncultured Aliiroseovarius sp.]|uniref:protein-glutamate methylesterase/protein-glutamine glutaminase n=1 Tax=uncultured Aliiroseovarius sp. TaxID=1658783 RepID=UPI0026301926|nr:chemotaxis response regulator protein-glutamate methylesterase [uncultured Aliiroseovarius sp.]
MQEKTRVLIVDDSASMRALIRQVLQDAADIAVVGQAASAQEARDLIKKHNPDVLTLDVEMPGMDGIAFLEKLMRLRPMPVVMLSSFTPANSDLALAALSMGAVDCVEKPAFADLGRFRRRLAQAIRLAATVAPHSAAGRTLTQLSGVQEGKWNGSAVLIGASTGGVDALETVLSGFPAMCPPTLIVQHMPALFLERFADRLNEHVLPHVSIAQHGQSVGCGEVILAPGENTHLMLRPGRSFVVDLVQGPKQNGHRPSVDALMRSAVPVASRVVGVVLTGMGRDGAQGMAQLRAQGAKCAAQNEASSVVFGMPRAAIAQDGVDRVLPLSEIARWVLRATFDPQTTQAFS